MNSNYPPGAEFDSRAPWKEEYEEVEVLVSITMSKVVNVLVPKNNDSYNLKEVVNHSLGEPEKNFPEYDIDDYVVMLN